MADRAPGPLLVRLPNWLGDLVLAWPVVEASAALERGAVFAGPETFRSLVEPRFPRVRYVAVSRSRRYAPAGTIRALRPRAALLLTDSFSSALLALLAGAPSRIGYAAEWRDFLLTRRVRREGPARSTARAAEYRALAREAGLDVEALEPRLRPTEEEARRGAARLAEAGAGGAAYAVLAPGAAYGPAKQWGTERFAAVGAHLARRHGAAVVIVGAATDREPAREVAEEASRAGVRTALLTGSTDLAELAGILAGAKAVVSNDSGVMHLAAALGRPTVAVFGSTSPVWTSAASPWVENLYAAYPCSPCFRRTCPIGYGCLRAIESSAAAAALDRLLG